MLAVSEGDIKEAAAGYFFCFRTQYSRLSMNKYSIVILAGGVLEDDEAYDVGNASFTISTSVIFQMRCTVRATKYRYLISLPKSDMCIF